MLAASLADAVEARGLRRGAGAVGAAGALGFAAELAGVHTGPAVRPLHVLGQARAARRRRAAARGRGVGDDGAPVVGRGGLVGGPAAGAARAAAGALTAWDVFLDPRMAREGYWSWPGGGRYEGVPASNFLGWFGPARASSPSGRCSTAPTTRGGRRRRAGAVRVDVGGRDVANAVLWRRPCVAAAGGGAMGAFAVPALRRRGLAR